MVTTGPGEQAIDSAEISATIIASDADLNGAARYPETAAQGTSRADAGHILGRAIPLPRVWVERNDIHAETDADPDLGTGPPGLLRCAAGASGRGTGPAASRHRRH